MRAEAADHRLEQDVPAAAPVRARLLERVVAGDVDLDAARQPLLRRRRGCPSAPLVVENVAEARRVDLLERRVPVLRDVHEVVRREVRARAAHRAPPRRRGPSRRRSRALFVASPAVWKTTTSGRPDRRYRTLGACAGSSRTRSLPGIEKLWYQRLLTWLAANTPKSVSEDPGADHLLPVARDDVSEASEHGPPSEVRNDWRLLVAPELIGRLAASVSAG